MRSAIRASPCVAQVQEFNVSSYGLDRLDASDAGGDEDLDSFTALADHDDGTDPTSAGSTRRSNRVLFCLRAIERASGP